MFRSPGLLMQRSDNAQDRAHHEEGGPPRVLVREQFYEGNRSRLKSKRGRRDVPLSPVMAERLRTKKATSHRGDAPVFATIAGTELNRANVASRILKLAAKSAGVPMGELP